MDYFKHLQIELVYKFSVSKFMTVELWSWNVSLQQQLVKAQIDELHICSLRLKVLEWDPEFAFLTSSLVMQMLLEGNHTLRTIVHERRVKEPPIIPSPNHNHQQLIAKLDSHISSPLPLSQTIFKKTSEIFLFYWELFQCMTLKYEQSIFLSFLF